MGLSSQLLSWPFHTTRNCSVSLITRLITIRWSGIAAISVALLFFWVPDLGAYPEITSLSKFSPTFAKDAAFKVMCHGEVWIPLRTIPRMESPQCFEFLSFPDHGELSPIQLGADGEWGVMYRNRGDKDATKDRFSFRARGTGRMKSEAAHVVIGIEKPPAALSLIPEVTDFGEIFVGQKTHATITLHNLGGSDAVGRLVLPREFVAPDGDGFRVSEGGKTVISLEYVPVQEGPFSCEIRTDPFLGSAPVLLKGTARRRFSLNEISPTHWEVSNMGPDDLKLWLTNFKEWGLPGEFSLRQGEKRRLVLTPLWSSVLGTEHPSGVGVSDGFLTLEIPIPPSDTFSPVQVIGTSNTSSIHCVIGKEQIFPFMITNPDDFPRVVKWSLSSSSGGQDQREQEVPLSSYETKSLTARWSPSVPGAHKITLSISDRLAHPIDLTWKVLVSKDDVPGVSIPQHIAEPDSPAPEVPRKIADDSVPVPLLSNMTYGLKRSLFGKTTLVISFDRVNNGDAVTLDELYPKMPPSLLQGVDASKQDPTTDGGPGVAPIKGFRESTTADRVELMLANPAPGIHSLRVSVWGGERNSPLAASAFQIPVPVSTPIWKSWWFWISLMAMGFGLKKIQRSRKSG